MIMGLEIYLRRDFVKFMYKVTTLISELIPLRKKENLPSNRILRKETFASRLICIVSVEEYNRKRVDSV